MSKLVNITLMVFLLILIPQADTIVTTPIKQFNIGQVNCSRVSFSADGKQVYAGFLHDSTVMVRKIGIESDSNDFSQTLGIKSGIVKEFSSDGKKIITWSDSSLQIWDFETGQKLQTLLGCPDQINFAHFSPDGNSVLTGSEDYTLKLWDISTGQCIKQFNGHLFELKKAHFSSDGKRIISSASTGALGADVDIKIWDVASGVCLKTITENATMVKYFPSGKFFIVGSKVYDAVSFSCIDTLNFIFDGVYISSVEISPKELFIVYNYLNRIVIHDLVIDSTVLEIRSNYPSSLCGFSPDGKTLVSKGDDEIIIWDIETGTEIKKIYGTNKLRGGVGFSADGKHICCTAHEYSEKFKTFLWDAKNGNFVTSISGNSPHFSKNGGFLVTSDGMSVILTNMLNDFVQKEFKGADNTVYDAVISPDGNSIFAGDKDGYSCHWDVTTGLKKWIYPPYTTSGSGIGPSVSCVGFSPFSHLAAVGTRGRVRIWSATTGTFYKDLILPSSFASVYNLDFSPDSRYLITGGSYDEYLVRLWDVLSGACIKTFSGHTSGISSVEFSPDGASILTGSYDGTAKIWDVSTGICTHTFKKHTAGVGGAAYSPDGKQIITGSSDQNLFLWDIPDYAVSKSTKAVSIENKQLSIKSLSKNMLKLSMNIKDPSDISIVQISGREVARITVPGGQNSVIKLKKPLAPGIYFYNITSNRTREYQSKGSFLVR